MFLHELPVSPLLAELPSILLTAGTFGTAWTFIAYALVGVVAVLFIYNFVPETKNKTLEQISAELSSRCVLYIL